MRLTTKLVIGIILLVFIASISAIVGLSFTDLPTRSHRMNEVRTNAVKYMDLKVDTYKTVKIDIEPSSADVYRRQKGDILSELYIENTRAGKSINTISVNQKMRNYLRVNVQNDTLYLKIDLVKLLKDNNSEILNEIVALKIYNDNADVDNRIPGLNMKITGMKGNDIKLSSEGTILVKESTFDKLECLKGNIFLERVSLNYLNLDLDNVHDWKVNDCKINEENLSGSRSHYIVTPKSETKVLNWHPKNKEANLNVKISGGNARLEFK